MEIKDKIKKDEKQDTPSNEKSTVQSIDDIVALSGKCLIALPGIEDTRFTKSVIYVCVNSKEGSMGLMVNRPLGPIDFEDLFANSNINVSADEIIKNANIVFGGPMESSRGFVLHSAEYMLPSTLVLGEGIAITSTMDILAEIAVGRGPAESIIALGYVSWTAGQLEEELKGNTWVVAEASEELIFKTPFTAKWQKAMKSIGVDVNRLNAQIGMA